MITKTQKQNDTFIDQGPFDQKKKDQGSEFHKSDFWRKKNSILNFFIIISWLKYIFSLSYIFYISLYTIFSIFYFFKKNANDTLSNTIFTIEWNLSRFYHLNMKWDSLYSRTNINFTRSCWKKCLSICLLFSIQHYHLSFLFFSFFPPFLHLSFII